MVGQIDRRTDLWMYWLMAQRADRCVYRIKGNARNVIYFLIEFIHLFAMLCVLGTNEETSPPPLTPSKAPLRDSNAHILCSNPNFSPKTQILAADPNHNLMDQIPASWPKSQPQGSHPSLEAQTQASRPKSQPQGSSLRLEGQNLALRP